MSASGKLADRLPRTLGLWSSVALVIGITIGSGIFRSPAGIAQKVPSPTLMLALWVVGGLITLCGALSLADFTVFPSVRMLRRIEARKPGLGIPNDRLPPKLRGWVSMIEALPYYEKTTPPHWKG